MEIVFWIIAVILVLAGFLGTIIPGIPGPPLMFCGFFLAAYINNFQRVGAFVLILLGFLTAFSLLVDIIAAGLGAKKLGASRLSVIGAAVGAVFGIFMGIPGLLIGPFLGAVIGQYMSRQNLNEAGKIGFGTWLGLMISLAIKLGLVFAMLAIFITAFIF